MCKYLISSFLLFFCSFAVADELNQTPDPFVLLTVPKSGSHLLIKTLHLLTDLSPKWHVKPLQLDEVFSSKQYPYTHICLRDKLSGVYFHPLEGGKIKKIIGIRDFRDVCVSIVHQILKGAWPPFTGNETAIKKFKKMSFDDQLLFVINQEYEISPPKFNIHLEVTQTAAQALQLLLEPNVLMVRYEDLVGSNGGGSDEAQLNSLIMISDFLNLNWTLQEMKAISEKLYGNSYNPFDKGDFKGYQSTFRKGTIGNWKKHFKEHRKIAFKERLGDALIDLGYETNNDW